MISARGIWLLLYFSHENVSMLDGGFERWKKAGYPTESKAMLQFILNTEVKSTTI